MPDTAYLPPCPIIRRLPPETVNRIAAGEVVERPAAAVKELVENALDAGATRIAVTIEGGGLSLIRIEDDGCGMGADELPVALDRHATSKLVPDDEGQVDLLNIHSMGFRGEALPSIASVSKFRVLSRAAGEAEAFEIISEAGRFTEPRPAAWTGTRAHGTLVEVRDLFFATPARLKFMKSERAETQAVSDTLKRLAMARADVSVTLSSNGRTVFRFDAETGEPEAAQLARLGAIMGREFRENAIAIDGEREGVRVRGFAGLPTLNRGTAQHQYLFVNGRPVKDRLITGVIRAAYADFLARDRHPMAALFVDLDPEGVDVNVHPAKTEVRFRDAANVRGLLIGALRHGLAEAGHRASTTVSGFALGRMQAGTGVPYQSVPRHSAGWNLPQPGQSPASAPMEAPAFAGEARVAEPQSEYTHAPSARFEPHPAAAPPQDFPLGVARAQLHETYVVAQTADGIVIVDQHAAHERLVYEDMKRQMAADGVRRQALLIPEVVELGDEGARAVADRAEELLALGLEVEPFGAGAVVVRATPALFGEMDIQGLIRDLADELAELEEGLVLKERFEETMGNMACRSSIRSGRRLTGEEMNALLRQMEATPHSGQCNHGRPTYVELKLADIERLFGRR